MKKIYSIILVALLLPILTFAQVYTQPLDKMLDGKKLCLDPGHGGHDGDDREVNQGMGLTYWESDGVFDQANITAEILEQLGAEVLVTRHTNDTHSKFRQPSLAERPALANEFDADFFHSIHTNAGAGTANYTSVYVYGSTYSTEKLKMSNIINNEVYKSVYTSSKYNKSKSLGVLRGNNQPAVLSEASMHDFSREGRRLNIESYRKVIAWSYVRSYLEYYNAGKLPFGELAGRVLYNKGDASVAGDNNYKHKNEVNLAKVTLIKNGVVLNELYTDNGYNGYFMFDKLIAGTYTVKVEKGDYSSEQEYNVVNNSIVKKDIVFNKDEVKYATNAPVIKKVTTPPSNGSGVLVTWSKGTRDNVDGYNLYYSNDNEVWHLAAGESKIGSKLNVVLDNISDFSVVPTSTPSYYKVVSLSGGISSVASKVFVYRNNVVGKKVLLVDGYESVSGIKNIDESISTKYYKSLIQNKSIGRIETMKASSSVSGALMQNFDIVIWVLSNQNTDNENFSDIEFAQVKNYLAVGGQLIVTGANVGYDLHMNGLRHSEQNFYTDYLKAKCYSDDSKTSGIANGVEGTVFEGLNLNYNVNSPDVTIDVIKPFGEELVSIGEGDNFREDYYAQSILKDENGNSAAIAFSGGFAGLANLSKLIYYAFPLELLSDSDLNLILNKSVEYFDKEVAKVKPGNPAPAKLNYASVNSNNDGVYLSWEKSSNIYLHGYNIYYAEGETPDEWKLVADYKTVTKLEKELSLQFSEFVNIPTNTSLLKFKVGVVVSANDYVLESTSSSTFSIHSKGGAYKVLVVDGFDRKGTSYDATGTDLIFLDVKALAGVEEVGSVSSCYNDAVFGGKIDLSEFNSVFWILGEESTKDETFNTTEQKKVKSYLESGGALFVSGAEIAYDLGKGTAADKAFMKDYLKSSYKGDGTSSSVSAKGISGSIYEGLDVDFSRLWKVGFPDRLSAVSGADNIMIYNGSQNCGVAYSGEFKDGNGVIGAVVTLGFPIETADKKDIVEVFKKTINYFTSQNLSVEDSQVLQSTLAYPNPFTNSISVSVMLDKKTDIKLSVYNFMGQIIKSNVYENIEGNSTLKINTNSIPTGVYMVVMEDDKGSKKVFEVVKK